MPIFRRKSTEHSVDVLHFPGGPDPDFYVISCECGFVGPPHPTSEEAFAEAHSHNSNVREELIEVDEEEGGVGWLCLFCGATIDESPLRLSVNWTEGDWTERGTQREQWFAAHRACLVERVSDNKAVRGGPLFEEDSHGGQ